MQFPSRILVGLLVAGTMPVACVIPGIDADYRDPANAGGEGNGLGGNAAKGGNVGSSVTSTAAGASGGHAPAISGGATGNSTAGNSNNPGGASGGATGTTVDAGGSSAGGSGVGSSSTGGSIGTGGTVYGGTTSTTFAGKASGGATTLAVGGTTGQGGASIAGATSISGGASNPATGGVGHAGSGGNSAAGAAGGTSVAGASTLGGASAAGGVPTTGGASATGGWVSVAGALNTPLVPTKITTGFFTSCAVKSDGTAYCWGTEYCGALGNNSDGGGAHPCGYTSWYLADDYLHVTLQHSPVKVQGVTNAVAIARGVNNMHNCVVRNGGTVSCWGWDVEGELGASSSQGWSTVPLTVKNLSNVVAAVVGSDHSCALLSDSTVKCWGDNLDGAIGNGDPCSSGSCSGTLATAVLVAPSTPLDQVHSIFSGAYHTCALKNDGSVWCWGYNAKGQLGNGTTDDGRFAIRSNFPPALDVMTGKQFTCVRATDNALWCAGYNEYGGFGVDPPTPDPAAPIPTPVKSLTFTSPLVALAAGTYNACAIVSSVNGSSNVAQCWGDNWTGQLGDGTVESSLQPVSATGMSNVMEIAADDNHTCAVQAGSVYCWGNNQAGQIGTAITDRVIDPTKVEGLQL